MPLGRWLLLAFAAGLAASVLAGLCAASRAYDLASAYAGRQSYVSDEIYYVDTARRYLIDIFNININYYEWSNKTRNNYYNLEHPPLGKYIIALSMVACGDRPLCWRMPGIVESFLIPVLLFLGFSTRGLREGSISRIVAGLVAALASAADRILHVDASVAMLDIHLAFFTALAIALAASGKRLSALLAAAAASTVKMSGIAAVGGVFLLFAAEELAGRRFREAARILALTILSVALVWLLVYLPLLMKFSPTELVQSTLDALRWHTTSRPEGPPTSTPPGWLVNENPFVFSFSMVLAAAVTTPLVEIPGVVSACLVAALVAWRVIRGRSVPVAAGSLVTVSIFAMYGAIYVLGNHTFYSFYAVQLTPAVGASLGEILLTLLPVSLARPG